MVKKKQEPEVDWKEYWAKKKGKTPRTKSDNKTILIAVGGIVGIFILMAIIGSFLPDPQKSDEPEKTNTSVTAPAPEPEKAPEQNPTQDNDKELKARVEIAYDIAGVEITNLEKDDWDNCQLTLNSDYKREIRNPLEPNSPLNNPYGLFIKDDGTRFNNDTTATKSVLIRCEVSGNTRYGYYEF